MRILVTGSSGAVGSATLPLLGGQPIPGVSTVVFGQEHEAITFDIMQGRDIRQIKHLRQVIEDQEPDRILHLAAVARFADADSDPLRAYSTNVQGTEVVAREAEYHSIPLVYASTGSVYIGSFLDRMNRGLAPVLYGGRQSNDFTYIEDIATANLKALTAPWDAWNQVYNIGTGEEITAEDAVTQMADVFGYRGPISHNPSRTVDASRFVYDVRKATERLGFTAEYSFKMGLEAMAEQRLPFES
jgi:nucleoside-diphosphate-sugar epimerase